MGVNTGLLRLRVKKVFGGGVVVAAAAMLLPRPFLETEQQQQQQQPVATCLQVLANTLTNRLRRRLQTAYERVAKFVTRSATCLQADLFAGWLAFASCKDLTRAVVYLAK